MNKESIVHETRISTIASCSSCCTVQVYPLQSKSIRLTTTNAPAMAANPNAPPPYMDTSLVYGNWQHRDLDGTNLPEESMPPSPSLPHPRSVLSPINTTKTSQESIPDRKMVKQEKNIFWKVEDLH